MIRIELDRLHLELLLLAGLFATFAGVVFPSTMRYGINTTPLVAFGGGIVVALYVLVHRRIFTGGSENRSRTRAIGWFALLGAVLGAAVASAVEGTPRSMVIAALGGAGMFAAVGTQFSIGIRGHDEVAREAVESVLEERNVIVIGDRETNEAADDETTTDEQPSDADEDWDPSQADEDDNPSIPIIRSVESGEHTED